MFKFRLSKEANDITKRAEYLSDTEKEAVSIFIDLSGWFSHVEAHIRYDDTFPRFKLSIKAQTVGLQQQHDGLTPDRTNTLLHEHYPVGEKTLKLSHVSFLSNCKSFLTRKTVTL